MASNIYRHKFVGLSLVFILTFFGLMYIISLCPYQLNDIVKYSFASSNMSNVEEPFSNDENIISFFKINNSSEIKVNSIYTNIFDKLSEEDRPLLCGDNIANSNFYVKEFITPILCSQPVGVAVDKDNNIWIASGKSGTLLVFNPSSEEFVKLIKIPNWTAQNRNIGSMIWDMKFDKNGDLWFTDEISNSIWKYFINEGKFENYKLLGEGGYPLSIAFDSENKVWYTQVFGKRLGFLEPEKTVNNTSEGISELDISSQINFQTMGPISNGLKSEIDYLVNKSNNTNQELWFSTAVFPVGGQIIKYDIESQSLTIHDLNHTHSVPFSISEDETGLLWANSHIANLFLSLNPKTGEIRHYSTSNPSSSGNLTTLPYYNVLKDGKIWFNEHYGNAIASFDPKNKTLVEYYIPSHNPLWANSSNPLRFVFDNNGSVWFTEWTENKLGVIPANKLKELPIILKVSKDTVNLDSKSSKGDQLDIYIYHNKKSNSNTKLSSDELGYSDTTNITMAVTSSISKNGKLDNLTSSFSDHTLPITRQTNSSNNENIMSPQITSLRIEPKPGVIPGNYTLTISAKFNQDLTISKIVDMIIH